MMDEKDHIRNRPSEGKKAENVAKRNSFLLKMFVYLLMSGTVCDLFIFISAMFSIIFANSRYSTNAC